jgi:hypothetical protein
LPVSFFFAPTNLPRPKKAVVAEAVVAAAVVAAAVVAVA